MVTNVKYNIIYIYILLLLQMVINVKYNIIYIYFIYFWPAIEQF